ncbi:MAG: thiosulfate/3-mercaptopyruvate sulfurtransferase [Solirubrobacteraceae bacterium]|jgi:thiosulfate/3-mercaptopyruvate sulfurtransferase|nr:thiosulfate/3-mercaptopyruvate sulfurtransferase [Solirubrobacteraceae bacterium]
MAPLPPLISAGALAARLEDPRLRVLDATTWLTIDPHGAPPEIESGRAAWEGGHIPGSGFAGVLELSDPDSDLRFTLLSPERFAEAMSALGVGPGTHVVAYDRESGMWATRLWWMLRAFGFDDVSVLDGGLRAWRDAGLAVSTDRPSHPPATFAPRPRPELIATRADVEAAIAGGETCTINALAAPLHSGQVPVVPGRPGRIPGSVNVPSGALVDPETNRFLPAERLREHFDGVGALDRPRIVTYCGGGIAATLDAFALALLGRDDVAVYDGSMVDWAADPSAPLEVG